jgi:hypothetical protein
MTQFRYINFYWITRARNSEANDLAQMASGYKAVRDGTDLQVHLLDQGDWRANIFKYLKDSVRGAPKRIRYKAMRYILIGDDMFYRTLEGLCGRTNLNYTGSSTRVHSRGLQRAFNGIIPWPVG